MSAEIKNATVLLPVLIEYKNFHSQMPRLVFVDQRNNDIIIPGGNFFNPYYSGTGAEVSELKEKIKKFLKLEDKQLDVPPVPKVAKVNPENFLNEESENG